MRHRTHFEGQKCHALVRLDEIKFAGSLADHQIQASVGDEEWMVRRGADVDLSSDLVCGRVEHLHSIYAGLSKVKSFPIRAEVQRAGSLIQRNKARLLL